MLSGSYGIWGYRSAVALSAAAHHPRHVGVVNYGKSLWQRNLATAPLRAVARFKRPVIRHPRATSKHR